MTKQIPTVLLCTYLYLWLIHRCIVPVKIQARLTRRSDKSGKGFRPETPSLLVAKHLSSQTKKTIAADLVRKIVLIIDFRLLKVCVI